MNTGEKKDAFREIAMKRRSVRRYDETVDISREEISEILEMAVTAPSSSNMQPWRFVVMDRAQAKEKLLSHVQFNRGTVSTASAVIAVFGDLESVENAEHIMQETDEIRGRTAEPGPEGKNPRERIISALSARTKEEKKSIALIDCGLVTMQLMQAARVFGYDTCPLGAYDRETVGRLLEMESKRYEPVMLLIIGKAAAPGIPPYRLPVSAVTKFYGQ